MAIHSSGWPFLVWPVGYYLYPSADLTTTLVKPKQTSGTTAYIINLDRSKKRWHAIFPKVSALDLPVTRISAVDGKTLPPNKIARFVDLEGWLK